MRQGGRTAVPWPHALGPSEETGRALSATSLAPRLTRLAAGSPGARVAAADLDNKLAMGAEPLPVLLDIGHGLAQEGISGTLENKGLY